jgi:hypothetical protein
MSEEDDQMSWMNVMPIILPGENEAIPGIE